MTNPTTREQIDDKRCAMCGGDPSVCGCHRLMGGYSSVEAVRKRAAQPSASAEPSAWEAFKQTEQYQNLGRWARISCNGFTEDDMRQAFQAGERAADTEPQPDALEPDIPPGCEMARGWAVEVTAQGERVLLLSDVGYSGLTDIEPWASTIRGCAEHLQAFIGPADGAAAEFESLETGESDATERSCADGCRYALDRVGLAPKCIPGCAMTKGRKG